LGQGFLGAAPHGIDVPGLQQGRTAGALREDESMEAIGDGRKAGVRGANPTEERAAHQEIARPPPGSSPARTVIGRPEGEPLLDLVNTLVADSETPENLDNHRGRVPPPRMNPGGQDGDRAFAGGTQVAPRLELQQQTPGEPEDLALVGTVSLQPDASTLIASRLATIRLRA
jgi:hypothetical protein